MASTCRIKYSLKFQNKYFSFAPRRAAGLHNDLKRCLSLLKKYKIYSLRNYHYVFFFFFICLLKFCNTFLLSTVSEHCTSNIIIFHVDTYMIILVDWRKTAYYNNHRWLLWRQDTRKNCFKLNVICTSSQKETFFSLFYRNILLCMSSYPVMWLT